MMFFTIVGLSILISAATAKVTEREMILCHTGVRFEGIKSRKQRILNYVLELF